MQELREKFAVVIGGGSGIGRGIALALAEAGAHVAVADLEKDSAEAVATEVAERGVRSLAARCDVTEPASLEDLVAGVREAFGSVQLLSNNAGVTFLRPSAQASEADWQWVMSVNLHGIVNAVRAFVPQLRGQPGGAHIVNTASMAALLAGSWPGLGLYTASKHAVLGLCETLRAELASDGIGVSVLCPGMVRSNLGATSARNRPARFGGPLPPPGETPEGIQARMMPAEECGRLVVRAIRADRFHIITHPDTRAAVEARHRRLLEDYDFAEAGTR